MGEHRFSSEDKVERAIHGRPVEMRVPVRRRRILLLHEQSSNYEQTAPDQGNPWRCRSSTSLRKLQDAVLSFMNGKPMGVELPATVDLTVVETEPGLKGATVSNVTKPAKLETGLVVQVPAVHCGKRKDPRQYGRRHVTRSAHNSFAQRFFVSSERPCVGRVSDLIHRRCARSLIGAADLSALANCTAFDIRER